MKSRYSFQSLLLAGVCLLTGSFAWSVELPDSIVKFDYTHNYQVKNPVLRHELRYRGSNAALIQRCAPIMKLSDAELVKLLPRNGGVFFANCPVPGCGNRGEKFSWDIAKPNVLRCLICKNDLTVEKYPETESIEGVTPEGVKVKYSYHTRKKDGRRCWISSGIDHLKYKYFELRSVDLATYALRTNNKAYARKAAIIIAGLSKAYKNSPYKIEPWLRSPYKEVHLYKGMPTDEEMLDYQRARPTYWAYMDIPTRVILAYDFIGGKNGELGRYAAEIGMDIQKDIVEGYFIKTVESTMRKKDPFGNMSVYHWTGMLTAGMALGIPEYVHLAVLRLDDFVRRGFFFDGAWYEIASGYHTQCVNAMGVFRRLIDGYSDPKNFKSSYDGSNYQNFKLFSDNPGMLHAASLVNDHMLYPDNTAVAHNDTLFNLKWRWGKPGKITPSSFVSSWRHVAIKGRVMPQQTQLRISAGPVASHRHQDMFNITLWALGRELLGDIGYTHTRYRQYASSLPHHNTVTVDYKLHNWWAGSLFDTKTQRMSTGAMPLAADLSRTAFQFTSFEGSDLYPEIKKQRRTVMLVEIDEKNSYAADFFNLDKGGKYYDYFLHGDCQSDNLAPVEKGFKKAELLPQNIKRYPEPTRETDKNYRKPGFPYQAFRNTMRHSAPADVFTGHFRYASPAAELTVHLAAFGGKREIFIGESPSIWRAKENSSRVNKFYRRFYLQRISNPTGPVHFAGVMEPHLTGKAQIKKVSVPARGVIKVELAGRTDYLFNELTQSVTVDGITLQGEYGFISLDKSGKVRNHYVSNASIKTAAGEFTSQPAVVLAVEKNIGFDAFQVKDLSKLPENYNRTIVLQLPGENSAWMFNIASIDRTRKIIKLDRPHGLEFQPDGTIRRNGYQRRTFPVPAQLKISLPSFGGTESK